MWNLQSQGPATLMSFEWVVQRCGIYWNTHSKWQESCCILYHPSWRKRCAWHSLIRESQGRRKEFLVLNHTLLYLPTTLLPAKSCSWLFTELNTARRTGCSLIHRLSSWTSTEFSVSSGKCVIKTRLKRSWKKGQFNFKSKSQSRGNYSASPLDPHSVHTQGFMGVSYF